MADNNQNDDFVEDAFEDEPKSDDVDGGWADDDEYAEESSEEDVAPPVKKKSKLSNVIIIAVVLILAVGYFLFMGGSSDAPTTAAPETEVAVDGEAAPAPNGIDLEPPADAAVAPAPADAADQGFLVENNPETLVTDIPVVRTTTPQPTLPTTVDNVSEPKAALPDNNQAEPAVAATAAEFPTVDKILKPQADTDVEKTVEPAVVPTEPKTVEKTVEPVVVPTEPKTVEVVAAPIVPSAVDDTPVLDSAAMKEKLVKADLEAQLAEEQAKSADLQKRLEAAQNATEKANVNANANEVEALKVKIAGLEQRLLEKADNESASEPVVAKAVRRVTPIVKSKPVASVASQWVLKAASSGRALIAHKGGADLRTVYVGDTVESIGRIVAIENGPSGWKVKGTKATLSQ